MKTGTPKSRSNIPPPEAKDQQEGDLCVSCDQYKPLHKLCLDCAIKLGKDNGWISVKDRLPENMDWLLVCINGYQCSWVGYHEDGKWYDEDGGEQEVTHWQPLPPPPTKIN